MTEEPECYMPEIENKTAYEKYSCQLSGVLKPIMSKSASFPLYHYTSGNALRSILENSQLWLSKWNCMNDPSEFLLVHDIIKEELKAYREKDRAFYDLISDYNQIEKAIKCSEEMYSSNDDIFILSFTRKCDSLNMWTCYSKAGHPDGYSITFNNAPNLSVSDSDETRTKIDLKTALSFTPVTYDKQEQTSLVKSFIKLLNNAFNDAEVSKEGEEDRRLILDNLFWSFTHQVGCRFKHEKYAQEEEVRAILCLSDAEKQLIKHRALNGIIVPYVPLKFDLQSIAEICIGPTLRNKGAFSGIQSLKRTLGLSYEIFRSEIPFRLM